MYFDPGEGGHIARYNRECLLPSLEVLAGWLDDGVRFSMCITGTAVDLLEEHAPDGYELLAQVAVHRNTELLGKTYYNSIAGLFDSPREYEEQLRLHSRMLQERFSVQPRCLSVDWNLIRPRILPVIQSGGYSSFFISGVDCGPGGDQPAGVYSCMGFPSLVSHCVLADDVAARFDDRNWDRYPLTASLYADWISRIPAKSVPIQFGIEVFGSRYPKNTGIFDFLRELPEAILEKGVEPLTASEALARHAPEESSVLPDPPAAGGVYPGNGLMMNTNQYTAFSAVQNARRTVGETPLLRHLQAVDHIRAMSMRFGWCGRAPHYRDQHEVHHAFSTFMNILSDLEERSLTRVRSRKAARTLRSVPPEKAFHFSYPYRYAGFSAHNLAEFQEMVGFAPDDVIAFHQERDDFARWIEGVLEDTILAREVHQCRDRSSLSSVIRLRVEYLENRLK